MERKERRYFFFGIKSAVGGVVVVVFVLRVALVVFVVFVVFVISVYLELFLSSATNDTWNHQLIPRLIVCPYMRAAASRKVT